MEMVYCVYSVASQEQNKSQKTNNNTIYRSGLCCNFRKLWLSKKCDLYVQTWSTNDSLKVPVVLEAVWISVLRLFRYKLRRDFLLCAKNKTWPGVGPDWIIKCEISRWGCHHDYRLPSWASLNFTWSFGSMKKKLCIYLSSLRAVRRWKTLFRLWSQSKLECSL